METVRGSWAASIVMLAFVWGCSGDSVKGNAEQDEAVRDADAGATEASHKASTSSRDDDEAPRGEDSHKAMDAGAPEARRPDEGAKAPEQKDSMSAQAPSRSADPAGPDTRPTSSMEPPGSDEDAGTIMPEEPSPMMDGMQTPAEQATLVGLGQLLFEDTSLSLTRTQSCASCHEAGSAFTGSADHERPYFPVSRGAPAEAFGTRNAPTAMYTMYSPPFAFIEELDEPGEYTPTGGLFWDGRVDTLSEQAAAPFVNPREMALPDEQAVIERVREASYAWMFEPLFGPEPLEELEPAYRHVTEAIAAFERTQRFRPFSSKFDAYLRGQVQLSEQEQRGFELFQDPEKGNCIACHVGDPESREPKDWLFTDFSYDNLGIPRNPTISDNADPDYFDLGLCQSEAVMDRVPVIIEDKQAFVDALCGAFKVPTLRNVVKTAPYMHNGFFAELRDVVDFYVTRETEAARWYPSGDDGTVQKYNDLPEPYWVNVNTSEVPYDRTAGQQPRLRPEEIDAVVAFMSTLTDGYRVPSSPKVGASPASTRP